MEPDFNQLPIEIRSLIVNSVPDPEIYDTCNNPDLSYLCDWNFWRRRAIDKYQVPVWYFDLALSRGITGAYRYLEVSTQFQLGPKSVASISDGVVSGIYDLRTLFENAVWEDNLQLVEQLLPDVVSLLGEIFIDNFNLQQTISYDLITGLRIDILVDAYYGRWDIVTNYLINESNPISIGRLLTYLIYTQTLTGFSLVRRFNGKTSQYYRINILRATAQCGNEEQFKYLVSIIEDFQQIVGNYKQKLDNYIPIGHLYFGIFDLEFQTSVYDPHYSFLYDAYAGANQNIIKYFRDLELVLPDETHDAYFSLFQGRSLNLSNPVSFYNIISQINVDEEPGFPTLVSSGIDAAQLMIERFPSFLNPNILYIVGGNSDLLNFLLQKVMNMEDFQEVLIHLLEAKEEEPDYLGPVGIQIARSYLKET